MNLFRKKRRENIESLAFDLKYKIPELRNVELDYIKHYLLQLRIEVYKSDLKTIPWYMRLTMPFALLMIVLLFIFSPFHFLITGRWSYDILWLQNWLSSLRF